MKRDPPYDVSWRGVDLRPGRGDDALFIHQGDASVAGGSAAVER